MAIILESMCYKNTQNQKPCNIFKENVKSLKIYFRTLVCHYIFFLLKLICHLFYSCSVSYCLSEIVNMHPSLQIYWSVCKYLWQIFVVVKFYIKQFFFLSSLPSNQGTLIFWAAFEKDFHIQFKLATLLVSMASHQRRIYKYWKMLFVLLLVYGNVSE